MAPTPARRLACEEVTELTGAGLTQALEALDSEAGVECVGTSGFTTMEDVLLAAASSETVGEMNGGAA